MLNTICCIHSKIPPDDEQLIYSKYVEDDYWTKLSEKVPRDGPYYAKVNIWPCLATGMQ